MSNGGLDLPSDSRALLSWDALRAENLPPCTVCGQDIKPGRWITSSGVHIDCAGGVNA